MMFQQLLDQCHSNNSKKRGINQLYYINEKATIGLINKRSAICFY